MRRIRLSARSLVLVVAVVAVLVVAVVYSSIWTVNRSTL